MNQQGRTNDPAVNESSSPPQRGDQGFVPRQDQLDDRELHRLLVLEVLLAARTVVIVILAVALIELFGTAWYADTTRPGGAAALTTPRVGDFVAWLDIPRLGVHEVIIEGVGRAQLRHGLGHAPHTALPGVTGTAVIAGHSSVFGGPFGRIGQLVLGDAVNVTVARGLVLHYTIAQRARPFNRTSVVASNDDLVLVAGAPRFRPSHAIAVLAKPLDGRTSSSTPTVRLDRLVDATALLRPPRLAEVSSILAGLAILGPWETFRAARRREAGRTRLLAISVVATGPIVVLLLSVAWAFPPVF